MEVKMDEVGGSVLLSTQSLAKRWDVKPQTLRAWRAKGNGPQYVKLVGRGFYLLDDVMRIEREAEETNRPEDDEDMGPWSQLYNSNVQNLFEIARTSEDVTATDIAGEVELYSITVQRIFDLARSNPELTPAEIAEEVGEHVDFVAHLVRKITHA